MPWKPPSYLSEEPHAAELIARMNDAEQEPHFFVEVGLYLAVQIHRLAMAVEDLSYERHEAQVAQLDQITSDIRQIKAYLLTPRINPEGL